MQCVLLGYSYEFTCTNFTILSLHLIAVLVGDTDNGPLVGTDL